MPKLKTKRGAAKRFKKTGSGGYKHKQAFLKHLLTNRSSKRKRHLGPNQMVNHADEEAIRKLVPHL